MTAVSDQLRCPNDAAHRLSAATRLCEVCHVPPVGSVAVDPERVAWLVRDTERRITEAEATIAREAAAIQDRAEEIAAQVAAGLRIPRSVYTAHLDAALAARQAGYDLLVSLGVR